MLRRNSAKVVGVSKTRKEKEAFGLPSRKVFDDEDDDEIWLVVLQLVFDRVEGLKRGRRGPIV
eukprot:scaffold1225_cov164-Amphora_coffeaeformis.AAC.7